MYRRNIFRRTFVERSADWQGTRTPWAWAAGLAFLILTVSHVIFEKVFLMPPCEECVYIRLAFATILLGSLVALIKPKRFICRLAGYLSVLAGSFYGLYHAWTLMGIHSALRSNDLSALFGVKNCSLTPDFPFGLPLAEWFPTLFLPKGPCGADMPVVPPGMILGDWQSAIVSSIQEAGGWYLMPWWQTGTMAECAFLIFAVTLVWFLFTLATEFFSKKFSRVIY